MAYETNRGSMSTNATLLADSGHRPKTVVHSTVNNDTSQEEGGPSHNICETDVTSEVPQGRQVGVLSATFLMVNRIVGSGVYATTSTILSQSGSVGMSLIYWLVGALIAFAGFYVWAEFASAIPRNGGELNYLQRVYRKPKYLVASIYAAQALLLGQAAGNANTAGQYFMRAGGSGDVNLWRARAIGVAVLCSAFTIHSTMLKWGLRFQNILGSFKLFVLLLIVCTGFAALAGHTRIPPPSNFSNAFSGTRNDIYGIAECVYNGCWSYVGYSNLFYAAGEIKNPTKTIRVAGPLALLTITILYVLAQVAFFAAVPKEDILGSEQIVASLFFQNMFGDSSARALSVFVALSAVANVFSVVFSQGRLNQALGRDHLVPFSRILASNRPLKAPMAGIGWHVVVTLVLLLAPPGGDAYNFALNLSSYPLNVVNAAVGFGLLGAYLPGRFRPEWAKAWNPSLRAGFPVAGFFFLVSTFLVVVPWIPPRRAIDAVYADMWYAMAPAVSLAIFAVGGVYWIVWAWLLPRLGGYTLELRQDVLSDGTQIQRYEHQERHRLQSE